MFLYYTIMAFFKNLPFQTLEQCLFPPQCCDTLIHFLILWWLSNRIISVLLHNCYFATVLNSFFWTFPRYLSYGLSSRISLQSRIIRGVLVLPAGSLCHFPFPLFQLPSWFGSVSKKWVLHWGKFVCISFKIKPCLKIRWVLCKEKKK